MKADETLLSCRLVKHADIVRHISTVCLSDLLLGVCPCRYDEGIVLCESLLEVCPELCVLRDGLAELHIRKGNPDQAVNMWLHALAECPDNAKVFYHSCKFLMAQVSPGLCFRI